MTTKTLQKSQGYEKWRLENCLWLEKIKGTFQIKDQIKDISGIITGVSKKGVD